MGVDDPSKQAKVDDPQAPQMKWAAEATPTRSP